MLVGEKPLENEMAHLPVACQARLADDVFQYFKFIEPVADKENVLLGEEEFEKREDFVFRFCAVEEAIVCIVSDVILSCQDHAVGIEHRPVEMNNRIWPQVVRCQVINFINNFWPLLDR